MPQQGGGREEERRRESLRERGRKKAKGEGKTAMGEGSHRP